MAYRATDSGVRGTILLSPGTPTLPFIAAANSLTNKVLTNDQQGNNELSPSDLVQIETWLAAHFAACHPNEQQYASRTTEGATATFQGQTGKGLAGTFYGQTAMTLDTTNYLARHAKEVEDGYRRVASMVWLGEEHHDENNDLATSSLDYGPED